MCLFTFEGPSRVQWVRICFEMYMYVYVLIGIAEQEHNTHTRTHAFYFHRGFSAIVCMDSLLQFLIKL